jgi:hypothetical protein
MVGAAVAGVDPGQASEGASEIASAYPTDPDVTVVVGMGQSSWQLPEVRDSFAPSWAWSVVYPFSADQPTIALSVYDLDIQDHDLIGSCRLTLGQLLAAGERSTWPCGQAQVTVGVRWVQSL